PLSPDPVAQLVPRDRPQPTAEGVLRALAPEGTDLGRDRQEDLLHHVLGVRRLQALPAAPLVDQRAVQARKPAPGLAVLALDAVDQAGRGRSRLRRPRLPISNITGVFHVFPPKPRSDLAPFWLAN